MLNIFYTVSGKYGEQEGQSNLTWVESGKAWIIRSTLREKTHLTAHNGQEREEEQMYQRILVPLDGSPQAERAIPVASRLARASGGSLLFLRVVPPPIEFGKYARQHSVAWEKAIYERQRAQAADYLTRMMLLHAAALIGIEVEVEVATGLTAQTLVIAAYKKRADVIIMSSRRKTDWRARIFESLIQEIGRRSPVPVLALYENATTLRQAPPMHPWRIQVVLDGSSLAETALEPALHLAGSLGTSGGGDAVHLLRTVPVPSTKEIQSDNNDSERAVLEAEQYLNEVVARLRDNYPETRALPLTTSIATDVVDALARSRQKNGYDLVVLAHTGRTSLRTLLKRSIAEQALKATSLPLLLVRPPAIGIPVAHQ